MKTQDDYQTTSAKLDEVLAQLQQPDIDIETAAKLYEQGLALVKQCETKLKQTENKIEKLKVRAQA